MNGRRVPPTSSNGATDTNLIPQMLVNRVEVVTGGASAAYGSDAVSGVVNFVLDEKFEGLKLIAQSGTSSEGDDDSYKFGGAFGGSAFDDRVHVLLSAERYHSDGIEDRSSRFTSSGENTQSALTTGGFGTVAQPYYYVGNAHSTTSTFGGLITSGPLANQQFAADGTLRPFQAGTPIPGRPGYGINGEGIVNPSEGRTGAPSLTTNQVFGHVAYDVADAVTIFADASYATGSNKDFNSSPSSPGSGTVIFAENTFLNPAVSTLLAPGTSFRMNRALRDWAVDPQSQESRSTIVNAGFKGEIAGKFAWDLYYTRGDSRFDTAAYQFDNRKFFAAIDAVRNASGQIVCNVTITNPGLMDDCVPLDIFGEGSGSQAARNYVHGTSQWHADNKMDVVAADISGEPFSLWAGPVALAVGVEYRHQSIVQTSNADPAKPISFDGIRGVTITNHYSGVNVGTGAGAYTVKEAFGEVAVPILKDSAVGNLDLNGALRYTDYSTSGSVTTWKVGGSYEPVSDIRFRGTLSQDIRAPSLFELFAGRQQTTSPLTDLHTSTSSTTNVISSGNPELDPETARTLTAGVVLSPSFWPGFNMSIDYYNIRIEDAIAQPFTYIQMADLCERSNGTSEVCGQIIRPFGFDNRTSANFPTEVRLQNLNLARTRTSGFDVEASYRTALGSGTLGMRLIGTRLLHYKQQNSPESPVLDFAGNADFIQGFYPLPLPEWRGNFELNYSNGELLVSAQERYIGSFHKSDQFVHQINSVPETFYTDLNLSYRFAARHVKPELFVTVNNVFDQDGRLFLISPVPGLNIPTARSVYDIVGRYFTVGVRVQM
jgi:outer membrane receptor protein involved in Fe transport